jgi:hypothetical protein
LEFLGLKADSGRIVNVRGRQSSDIGIEHFANASGHLPRVSPGAVMAAGRMLKKHFWPCLRSPTDVDHAGRNRLKVRGRIEKVLDAAKATYLPPPWSRLTEPQIKSEEGRDHLACSRCLTISAARPAAAFAKPLNMSW